MKLLTIAIAALVLFGVAAKYKEAEKAVLAFEHVKKAAPVKVVAYMIGL